MEFGSLKQNPVPLYFTLLLFINTGFNMFNMICDAFKTFKNVDFLIFFPKSYGATVSQKTYF